MQWDEFIHNRTCCEPECMNQSSIHNRAVAGRISISDDFDDFLLLLSPHQSFINNRAERWERVLFVFNQSSHREGLSDTQSVIGGNPWLSSWPGGARSSTNCLPKQSSNYLLWLDSINAFALGWIIYRIDWATSDCRMSIASQSRESN